MSAVINLARNLGISTVAEGIETPVQAAHVAVQGCDIGQGYLFGRPMAAAHVSDVVVNWSAPNVLSTIAAAMRAGTQATPSSPGAVAMFSTGKTRG